MHQRRLGRRSGVVVGLLSLCAVTAFERGAEAEPSPSVDVYRELEIVHPAVVDPFQNDGLSSNGGPQFAGGPWSLRTLLEQLAPTPEALNDYVRGLFEPWGQDFAVPGSEHLPPRDASQLQQLLFDQFSHLDANNQRVFELWKAPFELIAIANRLDLRSSSQTNNGELRFVYKLTHPDQPDLEFTLIVEFLVPVSADFPAGQHWDAADWAREWHTLGTLEIGSAEYLAQLRSITDRVTRRVPGQNTPRLAHIRSNEKALDTPGPAAHWEMREFRPTASGMIAPSVTENSPLQSLINSSTLRDFVLGAQQELGVSDTSFLNFEMPEALPVSGLPFLGARSVMGSTFRWQAPTASGSGILTQDNSVAMDNFGMLTCNGCHNENKVRDPDIGEIDFLHISPLIGPGQDGVARLSKFLTVGDVSKASRPAELTRRADDFRTLIGGF